MSTLYLLDTNIVSYYLRRSSAALEQRMEEALRQSACAISTVTRAELRFGQALMAAQDRRRKLIDDFLRQLPNLAWSRQAADAYAVVKADLKRMGRPVGDFDTQIAAHAIAEGMTLVTHNTRHFAHVPGLVLEDWMA